MKIRLLLSILICLLILSSCAAQDKQKSELEIPPSFRGGDIKTFNDWVLKKVVYWSTKNIERDLDGYVTISFTVNKRGRIRDIEILSTYDIWIAQRVILAVEEAPAWTPGFKNGKAVEVQMTTDIDFSEIGRGKTSESDLIPLDPTITLPVFSKISSEENSIIDRNMLIFSDLNKDMVSDPDMVLWIVKQIMLSKNELHGNVVLDFIINKGGYVERVNIVEGENPSLNALAIRTMYSCPKWYAPGYKDGVPINIEFRLPITID